MKIDSIKERTKSVWGASPAGTTLGGGAAPGTREFFDAVLEARSTYEMPWLGELVPFESFQGRAVLELGCGAGYDAYAICKSGARYTGIDIVPDNPVRTRKHLEPYGFDPRLIQADAEALPFDSCTFDSVFSNGVLHHTPYIQDAFDEANRVLKPGGEFWVILYHRNSVFYRVTLALVDHFLRRGFLRTTLQERLARIEFTESEDLPLVHVYSRRQVRALLRSSGFEVTGQWVRKLTREDLPNVRFLRALKRRIPAGWLDKLGRRWGWYIIARGVKSR